MRDDLPPGMRWKILAIALGFAAGGCFAIWLGLTGLIPFIRAFAAHAPVIAFRPMDLVPIPIALSMFSFAVMCLLPVRQDRAGDRRRKAAQAVTRRAAVLLLGVAVCGIVLAMVAAPIGRMVVAGRVEDRGYRRCPDLAVYEHRPPLRWHLPTGACP